MKKTYVKPLMESIELQSEGMMALSLGAHDGDAEQLSVKEPRMSPWDSESWSSKGDDGDASGN